MIIGPLEGYASIYGANGPFSFCARTAFKIEVVNARTLSTPQGLIVEETLESFGVAFV